jgi:hypothetical protein
MLEDGMSMEDIYASTVAQTRQTYALAPASAAEVTR